MTASVVTLSPRARYRAPSMGHSGPCQETLSCLWNTGSLAVLRLQPVPGMLLGQPPAIAGTPPAPSPLLPSRSVPHAHPHHSFQQVLDCSVPGPGDMKLRAPCPKGEVLEVHAPWSGFLSTGGAIDIGPSGGSSQQLPGRGRPQASLTQIPTGLSGSTSPLKEQVCPPRRGA